MIRITKKIAAALLLVATACTTEPLGPNPGAADDSSRSRMTLELGLSTEEAGLRTRAEGTDGRALEDVFNSVLLRSIWIGVFDVETGEIVGQTHSDQPKGLSATVDVLYYDTHPVVRIFGVANYEGVVTGDGKALKDCLDELQTMDEFFSLSVDTEQADAAQIKYGAPLMMGVFMDDSKGFYTVEADGNTFKTSTSKADIRLTTGHEVPVAGDNMYDRVDFAKLSGVLHLRRLLSQITVVMQGSEERGITVSNVSYRRVNMPKEVWLQERTTYAGSAGSENDWAIKTPNKADLRKAYAADEDFMPVDGTSFTFYHYENKHWGVEEELSVYNDREAVRSQSEDPVFTALCGKEGEAYNNYASYFEIRAYVEDPKEGGSLVTYRIHEGYCCAEDGSAFARNLRDFSCFRNTEYTYTITINGLNHIHVASATPGVESGEGGLWTSYGTTVTDPTGTTTSYLIPGEADLDGVKYLYYYGNGGDPIVYGNWTADLPRFSGFPEGLVMPSVPSAVPDAWGFTIGGQNIDALSNLSPGTEYEVQVIYKPEVQGNPDRYLQALYIYWPEKDGDRDEYECHEVYYCDQIYFRPDDPRESFPLEAVSLAFANTWDNAASAENGAVAGHISEINASLVWTEGVAPSGVDPVYTVYLDGQRVYSGAGLSAQNLYDLANNPNWDANSTHKVEVFAHDRNELYKDAEICETEFVVYPETFSWSYASGSTDAENYFYGQYSTEHDYEFADNHFYGIFHTGAEMTIGSGYLQTNGGAKDVFRIEALYDGILTIEASSTGGAPQINGNVRSLVVKNHGEEARSFYSVSSSVSPHIKLSFYVKKGEVDIAVTNNARIYSVELSCRGADAPHPSGYGDWNFSNDAWKALEDAFTYTDDKVLDAEGNKFYTGKHTGDLVVSVDGLNLVAGENKSLTGNSSRGYIQLGNTGNTEACHFWFWITKPGTVTVNVAADSNNRPLALYVDDGRGEVTTFSSSESEAQSFTIDNVSGWTKVYLYSKSGSINVSRIRFSGN